MGPEEVGPIAERVLSELERAVVGKREALELVLLGLLADGHVLIDDYPGLAKTLMARSIARVLGLGFSRIQFTPDLMPADVTGSVVFNQRSREFELRRGPVFSDLLLGDEVNRAPPKTQAALLEAMGERQVTIDGTTHPLGRPFLVIATQNPIEYEGTYPLPEAQLDRFLLRTGIGYPAEGHEAEMVARRLHRRTDEVALARVVDLPTVVAMQDAVELVHVDTALVGYVVSLVAATRANARIEVGASPRGSLAVVKLARARAAVSGRDFVVPDDVKAVAVPALAHRLILRTELWVRRVRPEEVMADILGEVPVPTVEELPG